MNAPWLTVAMTVYNGHDFLAAALESIAAQGDDGVEVIAVDDGSPDDTLAILEAYRSKLDLTVVDRGHTGNWITNMNLGLRMGRGRYACFLHHDDTWLDGRLAAVKAALAREPDTVLLVHPSWFIDRSGARLSLWRCSLREGAALSPEGVVKRLLVQNFIAMPGPVFRRDVALGLGGLDETNWYSSDWDLWLKLAAAGKTTYLGRPLACYRVHPVSATWRGTQRAADFRGMMDGVLDRHFAAWECRRPIPAGVRRVARFSVEANTRLASYAHGGRARLAGLAGLAARFLALGPLGWHRYLRDSRIVERVGARIRAGILNWDRSPPAIHAVDLFPR